MPDARIPIRTLDYQRALNDMGEAGSMREMDGFHLFLESSWFELYVESLVEAGYENNGDLDSYTWNTFTYSQDSTLDRELDDRWWGAHRENPRIVAVHGFSNVVSNPRDNARLRYHGNSYRREYGPTPKDFPFDKGHFIGHKLGGQIDNGIFAQRRDVNRGWGEYRAFYAMERYAQANPGTFVFSRPIYGDGSTCPFYLEFGLLRPDGTWWIEMFPNRYSFESFRGPHAYPEWRRKELHLD